MRVSCIIILMDTFFLWAMKLHHDIKTQTFVRTHSSDYIIPPLLNISRCLGFPKRPLHGNDLSKFLLKISACMYTLKHSTLCLKAKLVILKSNLQEERMWPSPMFETRGYGQYVPFDHILFELIIIFPILIW